MCLRGRGPSGIIIAMNIDDMVMRIRRLPAAERQKLDEIIQSLEEKLATEKTPLSARHGSSPLSPVRGLLRDLGPAPSSEAIDEARREMWEKFPREDLP